MPNPDWYEKRPDTTIMPAMRESVVQLGLEVLLQQDCRSLWGSRVGLLVHPASVDSRLRHAVELLSQHPRVDLRALFGPQHGIRGETQDNMIEWTGFQDPTLHVPVFSLYGETRVPTVEMLNLIDTLVVDLQDVGSRYYTFVWTLALAMEACGRQGVRVMVLDRPNPLNGVTLEGPVLDTAFRSFVGLYAVPVRHGLTIGEAAFLLRDHFGVRCELEVVAMRGWQREFYWEDTGLPWVAPSPNIPRPTTALVYPGACLFEATNVSEGRGTTQPFELTGAPWAEPGPFARRLSEYALPGVVFRPLFFQPTFHKWCGLTIGGVQTHVTDRRAFRPWKTGLALLEAYLRTPSGRFQWNPPPYEYEYEKMPIDILAGTDQVRLHLESGRPVSELFERWDDDLELFARQRKPYLLY